MDKQTVLTDKEIKEVLKEGVLADKDEIISFTSKYPQLIFSLIQLSADIVMTPTDFGICCFILGYKIAQKEQEVNEQTN